ncbi:hypothetical protein SUGI_0047900 [Cryptomeria japonica]|nr:hypothetical protein SUGI_0047900 [Cryptomeria japonica]
MKEALKYSAMKISQTRQKQLLRDPTEQGGSLSQKNQRTQKEAARALEDVADYEKDGELDGEEDCVGSFMALLVSFLHYLGSVLVECGKRWRGRRFGSTVSIEDIEEFGYGDGDVEVDGLFGSSSLVWGVVW